MRWTCIHIHTYKLSERVKALLDQSEIHVYRLKALLGQSEIHVHCTITCKRFDELVYKVPCFMLWEGDVLGYGCMHDKTRVKTGEIVQISYTTQ